jgi:predicted house-cleaning NTP pyrophosphatase (Maf/HAM1 superfamily)
LSPVFSQQPNWIDFTYRKMKYPDREYLASFIWNEADRKDNPAEKIEELKEAARNEISSSLQVRVKSMTVSNVVEANEQLNKYFKQATSAYTDIELSGLKYNTYYDKRKDKVYVMGYVKKSALIDYYRNRCRQKLSKTEELINKAKSYQEKGNQAEAYKIYLKAGQIIKNIESFHSVLVGLQVTDPEKLYLDKTNHYKETIDDETISIKQASNSSLDDLAYFIADNLQKQIENPEKSIQVVYFTYGETQMTSPFSRRLLHQLKQELITTAGYHVKTINNTGKPGEKNTVGLLLTGSYWEEGSDLKVSAVLKDIQNGNIVAAVDDRLSQAVLADQNISFKPANFKEAYSRMQAFRKDEVIDGGMNAEVWTNKGQNNLLYAENDTMRLYVRVNKPAYIRVIYYLADGSKVLLLDNYYIGKDKVNKVYEIPDKFVCAPPFGVETLQLSARTKPFEDLQTHEQYGYTFIEGDVGTILKNIRGFKRVKNEDMKAEARLTITTMKK